MAASRFYYMGSQQSVERLSLALPKSDVREVGYLLSVPVYVSVIVPENEVWLVEDGKVTHVADLGPKEKNDGNPNG